MSRFILHIDMDAFFTSCEEKINPELKGKPVVVGSDPKEGKGRGVVSTCNYSARKYGVHSAMPISRAYKLNPKAIFIRPNFSLYCENSKNIMRIIKSYSDKFQQAGLDEAYLDITHYVRDWADAKILAYKIKIDIEKLGLTCSIGIANNKLVAKIASDFNKPNGITVVKENKKFLKPLNIRKLYGVGPKTTTKLNKFGIKTIGQLASFNKEKLIKKFGVYGLYLSLSANGIGNDFVAQQYGRISLGKERTFFEDIDDFDKINKKIEEIADGIFEELKEQTYSYRTINIKIRLHNFKTYTRSKTFNCQSNDKEKIIKTAKELCQEFAGNKIRLIGVRLSHLEEFKHQKTLEQYICT